MTTKYAYEFGKRWNVKTPRQSVKYLLNQVYVGAPFADIEADLLNRMTGAEGFTDSIIRETIEYARIVHTRNGDRYRKIMG